MKSPLWRKRNERNKTGFKSLPKQFSGWSGMTINRKRRYGEMGREGTPWKENSLPEHLLFQHRAPWYIYKVACVEGGENATFETVVAFSIVSNPPSSSTLESNSRVLNACVGYFRRRSILQRLCAMYNTYVYIFSYYTHDNGRGGWKRIVYVFFASF